LTHFLIYILPALNVIIQFLTNWAQIWRKRGDSCDILYVSLIVQIINLFLIYIIPVVLNIIILGLGIRHVSSIQGVFSQQIIDLRRKRQRILLLQTLGFYSIWLILWSPDILAAQFTNVNSDPATFTSLLSYIEIAWDPAIMAIIDVRFLTSWRTLWNKIKRHRQIGIVS
jgi:ABC-type bacteriocin/lantibiotic exporter with double-glycine peptidase domain